MSGLGCDRTHGRSGSAQIETNKFQSTLPEGSDRRHQQICGASLRRRVERPHHDTSQVVHLLKIPDFLFVSILIEQRSRRPPLDRMNALLSFSYSLLTGDCLAALQGVGLDPYVGFLHVDRPGRPSLALDLMEEFRPALADRFALTLVNLGSISAGDFEQRENGGVFLNDAGRKTVLAAWQKRKQEVITHPFLGEKMPWGLIPYVQALLLARAIRGDIDAYPPFMWK